MGVALVVSIIFIVGFSIFFYKGSRNNPDNYKIPPNLPQLLAANVKFYDALEPKNKISFESRVSHFLSTVAIKGVGVSIEDTDRVLVAAGAIIPIFAFPDWKYNNISEVLIYKDAFSKDFDVEGNGRNVLGMVGDGVMHRQMILSLPSVRQSFKNSRDGENTVIHEFVHLIDKADGATDGVPEYLLAPENIKPWIRLMHSTIAEMKQKRYPDIDIYAASGDTEFFAVLSEYFFERPDDLQKEHPELYTMLAAMFNK